MKPSHHMLRRRARARERAIDLSLARARDGDAAERQKLLGMGIDPARPVQAHTVPAKRGPWRWRVEVS